MSDGAGAANAAARPADPQLRPRSRFKLRKKMMVDLPSSNGVMISWAHVDTDWTPETVERRKQDVLSLAALLRRRGISVELDLYHLHESIDWTRWGPSQIVNCQTVLVVVSAAWKAAWEGTGDTSRNIGAKAEADSLYSIASRDRNALIQKCRLIVLPESTMDDIPNGMHGIPRFSLDPNFEDTVEALLGDLTHTPLYPVPEVIAEIPQRSTSRETERSANIAPITQSGYQPRPRLEARIAKLLQDAHAIILYGRAGLGKSELARAALRSFEGSADQTFAFDISNEKVFSKQLKVYLDRVRGTSGNPQESRDDILATRNDDVILLDNVETAESLGVFGSFAGRLIATSRLKLPVKIPQVEVAEMSASEARRLFSSYCDLRGVRRQRALKLCGGVPLVIHQMANVLQVMPDIVAEQFIQNFENDVRSGLDVLSSPGSNAEMLPLLYGACVERHLIRDVERVVLAILVVVSSTSGVALSNLFNRSLDHLDPGVGNSHQARMATAKLGALRWLTSSEGAVRIHSLSRYSLLDAIVPYLTEALGAVRRALLSCDVSEEGEMSLLAREMRVNRALTPVAGGQAYSELVCISESTWLNFSPQESLPSGLFTMADDRVHALTGTGHQTWKEDAGERNSSTVRPGSGSIVSFALLVRDYYENVAVGVYGYPVGRDHPEDRLYRVDHFGDDNSAVDPSISHVHTRRADVEDSSVETYCGTVPSGRAPDFRYLLHCRECAGFSNKGFPTRIELRQLQEQLRVGFNAFNCVDYASAAKAFFNVVLITYDPMPAILLTVSLLRLGEHGLAIHEARKLLALFRSRGASRGVSLFPEMQLVERALGSIVVEFDHPVSGIPVSAMKDFIARLDGEVVTNPDVIREFTSAVSSDEIELYTAGYEASRDGRKGDAIHSFRRASIGGGHLAMHALWKELEAGSQEGDFWLHRSAFLGNPLALFDVGGLLVERNSMVAAEAWYRRLVGMLPAGHDLAAQALHNVGVVRSRAGDSKGAEEAFTEAARGGDAQALFALGVIAKSNGERLAAIEHLERSLQLGYARAGVPLGMIFSESDPSKALQVWEEAAEAGESSAMHNLGVMLHPSDPERAHSWWERASAHGETGSDELISKCVREGCPMSRSV